MWCELRWLYEMLCFPWDKAHKVPRDHSSAGASPFLLQLYSSLDIAQVRFATCWQLIYFASQVLIAEGLGTILGRLEAPNSSSTICD